VRLLLGPGRWDGGKEGEGDFTKGAGLDEEQIDRVQLVVAPEAWFAKEVTRLSDKVPPSLANEVPPPWFKEQAAQEQKETDSKLSLDLAGGTTIYIKGAHTEGMEELEQIELLVRAAGYGEDRIKIDPSVVRGLEYYTGPVYEAELLAEIPNEDGVVVRFGSVGGGGRYDGLVSRFRGEPVPATGFSIGVSRLMTALKNLKKLDTSDIIAPVVVLVMDRDTESLGRYQKMVAELRAAKIRAEMYLGGAGMKAQMKYADRRGSPCVVIQGGDERAKGEVQIKDMALGEQLSKEITDNAAWREGRPAQVTVAEGDLVAAVRKILDAQAEERSRG
jgi:histidyl-tRNA synthetase